MARGLIAYYANTLVTGQFAMELDESLYHKTCKYAMALGLSLYLTFRLKTWLTLIISVLFASQALYVGLAYPASGPIVDVHIVLICMSGLVGLLRAIGPEGNARLPYLIVGTGMVVGLLWCIEVLVLSELFGDRWARMGGLRSISTLFNPNNLGLYLGACAIFLLGVRLTTITVALAAASIGFGLVFSGSRTVWIALGAVVLFSTSWSYQRYGGSRVALSRLRFLVGAFVAGVAVWLAFTLYGLNANPGAVLTVRDFDPYTADVRMEHLIQFLGQMDWRSLMPDVDARNIELTTDSACLVLLNSLGALSLAVLLFGLPFIYRLETRPDLPHGLLWRYVCLLAGVADSTINTFPKSQMFLIACGALLNYRFTPKRPSCSGP